MPRKSPQANTDVMLPEEIGDRPRIVIGHHREKTATQTYLDAIQPLPGPTAKSAPKYVKEQRKGKRKAAITERSEGRTKYDRYVRALVASGGEPIAALADAYGITEEEASENAVALHADLIKLGGGESLAEVLKRYDLSREARLAVLRGHLYSPNPAASLKAVDILNDLDVGSGRVGGTFEDFVRLALAREPR